MTMRSAVAGFRGEAKAFGDSAREPRDRALAVEAAVRVRHQRGTVPACSATVPGKRTPTCDLTWAMAAAAASPGDHEPRRSLLPSGRSDDRDQDNPNNCIIDGFAAADTNNRFIFLSYNRYL